MEEQGLNVLDKMVTIRHVQRPSSSHTAIFQTTSAITGRVRILNIDSEISRLRDFTPLGIVWSSEINVLTSGTKLRNRVPIFTSESLLEHLLLANQTFQSAFTSLCNVIHGVFQHDEFLWMLSCNQHCVLFGCEAKVCTST